MSYRTEFPDFDYEIPALLLDESSWDDTSWKNDTCPSFTCDVFVLFVDYADVTRREFANGPQFTMRCEDEVMLETDSWEDVRAFIEDGKRDFADYVFPTELERLTATFAAWTEAQGLAGQGDAMELLMVDRTPEQREWLNRFVAVWDLAQKMEDAAYAPEEDAALKDAWDKA